MNNYIFDWNKNSENVFRTGLYTTKRNRFMEQVMLIRYLRDKQYDYSEVLDIWKNKIENQEYKKSIELSEKDREKYFDILWKKSFNFDFKPGNKIIIYKEEIDFINNLLTSLWIKQYVFVMMCIYKYFGEKWCLYNQDIKIFCYSCTSLKRERVDSMKILQETISDNNLYDIVCRKQNAYFKINFLKEEGDICYEIDEPRDVEKIIDCIKSEKICQKCGKPFSYTYKTKHMELCHECWLKKRNSENRSKK